MYSSKYEMSPPVKKRLLLCDEFSRVIWTWPNKWWLLKEILSHKEFKMKISPQTMGKVIKWGFDNKIITDSEIQYSGAKVLYRTTNPF